MITTKGFQRGQVLWQSDFEASKDNKGKWSGSHSFLAYAEDATQLIPQKGAPCQQAGFSFLGLDSVSVRNAEGGLMLINCRYAAGGEGPEFTFDDASTTGRKELAISTSEEPLLSHPRYKDVSEADMLKLAELAAGRYKALPAEEGEPTKYIQKVDGEGVKEITFEDELAAECASKLARGFTSYLQANQIYRLTVVSNNMPNAATMNRVGRTSSAPGAPSVGGGRTWLYLGCSAVEEGNSVSISHEWRLSDAGGWDEIYEGEEEE
jgi:hypothetical protein